MLVLNTTSPRASPSAPAATPRNQVPSSSARIASTGASRELANWRIGELVNCGSVNHSPTHQFTNSPIHLHFIIHLSSDAVTRFRSLATIRTDDDHRR